MNVKKILSLAVVLAMVMAVVPAFGVFAAETVTYESYVLREAANEDFVAPNGTYNNTSIPDTWKGWTVAADKDSYGNLKSYDEGPTLQIYPGVYNTGGDHKVTVSAPEGGYGKGKEYTMLSFNFRHTSPEPNALYHDVTIYDADGNPVTYLKIDKNHAGLNEVDKNFKMGYPAQGAQVDIVWFNNDTESYTVQFFVNDVCVSQETHKAGEEIRDVPSDSNSPVMMKTVANVSGFGKITQNIGQWNNEWGHIGYANLKVLSGNFPKVANLTVNYKAGNETVQKKRQLIAGSDYTFAEEYQVLGGEVYRLPEYSVKAFTEDKTDSVDAVFMPRYASKKVDENFVFEGNKYQVTGNTVVLNGDFTANTAGWTNPSNGPISGGGLAILHDDTLGNYMSVKSAGQAAPESVGTVWNVTPDQTYYISFWVGGVKPLGDGNKNARLYNRVVNVADGNNYDLNIEPDNEENGGKDVVAYGTEMVGGQWNHFEKVFTANEATLVFASRWAEGAMTFANVEVLPIELVATGKDVTVNFKDGDTTVYTETHKLIVEDGESFTVPAHDVYVNGKFYNIPETKVTESTDIPIAPIANRAYVTADMYVENGKVINPSDENKVMVAAVGKDTSGLTGPSTDADGKVVTDGIHSNPSTLGGARVGLMSFPLADVDVKDGQQVIAVLPVDHYHTNGYANGNTTLRYSAYALSDDIWTSSENGAELDVMSLKRLSENAMFSGETPNTATEVRFDVTDAVKAAKAAGMETLDLSLHTAWGAVYYSQLEDAAADGKAAYLTVVDGQTVTVEGSAKVTKNGCVMDGTTVVAQVNDNIGVYGADGVRMLIDGVLNYKLKSDDATLTAVAAPVMGDVALAYTKENALAITFDGTEGAKAVVTSNVGGDESLNEETTMPVAVVPVNANVTYTVAIKDANNETIVSKSQALYPLVVADIVENLETYKGAETLARVDAAVKALTEGGANYIAAVEADPDKRVEAKDAAIGSGRESFLTLTFDADKNATITIDKGLYKEGKGMGFKVGVKAGAGNTVAEAALAEGVTGEVFQSVTVSADGKTATVQAADGSVYTFSLESVQIEFVETEIAESDADSAGAEADFIPEL